MSGVIKLEAAELDGDRMGISQRPKRSAKLHRTKSPRLTIIEVIGKLAIRRELLARES